MTERDRIRVLIADDHRIVRDALRAVLERECEIVGEAETGEQAVELAARTRPQVVLLDIAMPGTGGLAAIRRLAQKAPQSRVLILSQYHDDEYVIDALNHNAAGYMVKTDAASELITALRAVAAGKRYLSPSVASAVIGRVGKAVPADGGLTAREREVLTLIGQGATSKEIAARLGISPKTAQVHRENLKQKLNLRSTAAMVRYAIKHKLLRID